MEKEFFEDPECIRVLSLLQDLFIPPECGLPEKTAKAESAGSKVLRMKDLSGTVKESTVNDSTVNAGISCLANTAGRITAAAGIMLRGEGRSAGISFIIDRDKFIIGRSSDADGVIKANRALGRRHFSILRMDSSYAIQDLGSVNGTFLNKKRNYEKLRNIKDLIANNDILFEKIKKIEDNNLIDLLNIDINYGDIIKYKINREQENVKIFDNKFVDNNYKNCKIEVLGKIYDLTEYFNINNTKKINSEVLEIKLKGIDNIEDMGQMFDNCNTLLALPDMSKWNIRKVNNLSQMFHKCSTLLYLPDMSKWDTSNISIIEWMFSGCSSLLSLPDISNWKLKNITDIHCMFEGCSSLLSLPDISKWDTSNITNIGYLFKDCTSLLTLPDISKWNTSNIIKMHQLFEGCSSLLSLPDISKWDISNVEYKFDMFKDCDKSLKIPSKFCN